MFTVTKTALSARRSRILETTVATASLLGTSLQRPRGDLARDSGAVSRRLLARESRWTLEADRLAVALSRSRDLLCLPLAHAARDFLEEKAWFSFGYARLEDHARERFGRSGRWVRDRAMLAESILRLPGLAGALTGEDGSRPLGPVRASIVARAATTESCREWLDLARRTTVRRLKEEVRRAAAAGSPVPLRTSGRPGIDADAREWGDRDLPGGAVDAVQPHDEPERDSGGEADPEHESRIRWGVPPLVRVAFDETRDLHSAIEGGGTSLSSFIEALVAEAYAGPPALFDWQWTAPAWKWTASRALREYLLDRERLSGGTWGTPEASGSEAKNDRLDRARATMDGVRRACVVANLKSEDPDALIRTLTRLENEVEQVLADLLAEMNARHAWRELKFSCVGHYGEERLGISRTVAEDRVRLARVLRELPAVREAYMEGGLGVESAMLLRRILDRESRETASEASWVEHARTVTIKRLRDELRWIDGERAWGVVGVCEGPPDDETWHRSLVRRPGRSLERVRQCGLSALESPAATGVISLRLPRAMAEELQAAVAGRIRSLEDTVHAETRGALVPDPDAPASLLAARMFSERNERIPEWVGLLSLIEDFVRTWDDPRRAPKRAADKVYERDGWRCSAPGCTSRRNLEEHHVTYRSRGGSDKLSNRTCLCRYHHHQGEHGGLASCRGSAPLGLVWTLGERGKGGRYRNERAV